MKPAARRAPPGVLVVDVGGSHVKCLAIEQHGPREFVSGPLMTPQQMVRGVLDMTADWLFDVLALGYPGVVREGMPSREPHNLGPGWVGFDFQASFGRPVKILNDAAMQALGNYQGGKMLFLGLGTGLGSALIAGDQILAMELGHLHCAGQHGYEYFLGARGFKRLGEKKWRRKVHAIVRGFDDALLPDDIVLGGGLATRLKRLPPNTRRGASEAAFLGGFRMWELPAPRGETPSTTTSEAS